MPSDAEVDAAFEAYCGRDHRTPEQRIRNALEAAELARLRAPAGEMGEVVKRLKEYAYPPKVEMEVGKTYTIRAPLADEFKDTLMTAADLLTRQAAEIESLKGWKDSWRSQLQKTVDTENTLLTALKVMHSARDSGDLSEMDIFLNDLEAKTND